ncbi:MAG: acyl-CoA thioesterase II [Myxococcota bacterium]
MSERTAVLAELVSLLKLEKIEENIFRGQSQDLGFGNIFGGQVLGQALSAALQTVPTERKVHSLHAYFLRPGDPQIPIVYDVDCIRDGKSFTTRRVVAIQKGRPIFSMAASFQIEERGFSHQAPFPEVTPPDNLPSELDRTRALSEKIPKSLRSKLLAERPIEIRVVNPINPFAPVKQEPIRYAWFRAVDRLPDDPMIHQFMLAYASDFGLIGTSLYPHGHTFWEPELQAASLDHAMWFYRPFRMDEWLLYVCESPSASGARGMNLGRIYQGDVLIASAAQEGLIRYHGWED